MNGRRRRAPAASSPTSTTAGGSGAWRGRPAGAGCPAGAWSLVALVVAALYVVPLTKPPLLNTPDVDFVSLLGSSVVPFILAALGLNVVVGLAGLLDLGYVGFYAIGAYTHRHPHQRARQPAVAAGAAASRSPWRWRSACCSARRRCACGATTWPSSRSASARSSASRAQNFEWLGAAEGISAIDRPPSIGPLKFSALNNNAYWIFGADVDPAGRVPPASHREQPGRAGPGPPSGRTRTRPS